MKASTRFLAFAAGFAAGLSTRTLRAAMFGLVYLLAPPILHGLVRGKSAGEIIASLEASGRRMSQQLMEVHPSRFNYHLLNHVVGIERWGQSRLRVSLGAPYIRDEYDPYRPPRSLSWNELQDLMAGTRRETVALARQIEAAGRLQNRVDHNNYGRLSILAWLHYLDLHAWWELLKIR